MSFEQGRSRDRPHRRPSMATRDPPMWLLAALGTSPRASTDGSTLPATTRSVLVWFACCEWCRMLKADEPNAPSRSPTRSFGVRATRYLNRQHSGARRAANGDTEVPCAAVRLTKLGPGMTSRSECGYGWLFSCGRLTMLTRGLPRRRKGCCLLSARPLVSRLQRPRNHVR